jgi:polyhydroxyalkanoate synthesis regulator phasin
MENKSEAVRLVSELFERAENQANTIDELKFSNVKLHQQLEDKYSTETHVLVKREVLQDLKMDFDELADGFGQLRDTFDNIESCASDISSEAEYHDARSFRETAIDCMSKIEDILDPMPEEETDKETV